MYCVEKCIVCGERERTIVAEYNRLMAIDTLRASDLARSDYALCHGCGLVYATLRPDHAEYEYVYRNFNELLMREKKTEQSVFVLPDEVGPELRDELDRGFVPWWELRSALREEMGRVRGPMLAELESTFADLPDLMMHFDFRDSAVLQVRAKTGQLADFFMRVLGARQVDLLTLFPAHTHMALKYPGIRAQPCLDYEKFRIPFDCQYDLIIENHVLIHMLNAEETFAEFRRKLRDGGALFIKNELDDERLFTRGSNMFAELRSFHFQQFDMAALKRMLVRFGFDPVGLRLPHPKKSHMVGLSRMQAQPPAEAPRIGPEDLRRRLAMYTRWRDESVLSLPHSLAAELFTKELEFMKKRVDASGGLSRDRKGRLPAFRPLAFEDRPEGWDELSALEAMAA